MPWTHYRDTEPKARKRHECYLCGLPIEPGEKYVRREGFNEGRLSFAMHVECERLTHQWDEDDWLFHEAVEFREILDFRRVT